MASALGFGMAFAALLVPLPAGAQGSANLTKRFGITSFDRVVVLGDMVVDITPSRSISAEAEGTRDALDSLVVEVQSRTLTIRQGYEGAYGHRERSDAPVRIHVTAQNLASVSLTGSGSIRVDGLRGADVGVQLDGAGTIAATISDGVDVRARTMGSGTVTLAGQARSLTAVTNGAATLDAAALTVRALDVRAVGSGASRFAATGTAAITAMGAANVTVTGNPQCTVRNLGAGRVECGSDVRNHLPQSVEH